MEQKERRAIGRIDYSARGIAVVCNTQKVIHVGIQNIGPSGVGLTLPAGTPDLVGKDLILITDTVIMYADVIRQEALESGAWAAGLAAKKFTPGVLQYLFDSIELKAKSDETEEKGQ